MKSSEKNEPAKRINIVSIKMVREGSSKLAPLTKTLGPSGVVNKV
jgi:hypothetical protein